jgi:ABC-2 type transport system permease protein
MSKISAIAGKELKGFFFSPNFYIVCFMCTAIFSYVYPISFGQFMDAGRNMMFGGGSPQQQNIHYMVFIRQLSYLNLMLIFVVPALTMRLFAEEKKMRTFDLLLTSPVTSFEIVLGKYLAALGAVAGITFLAMSYPLVSTFSVEKISWASFGISFLGVFLLGAVYAAMNMFCSSLTESAIVAYVMAVVLNVSIWFIGMAAEVVDGATARQVFEHLSLNAHLGSLVEGTVRTNSLVFFGSLIFLFCFLCERVVESLRWR